MKNFIIFAVLAMIFLGCSSEQVEPDGDGNDTAPVEVPIAQPDANISIDENLPPEPVVGG